MTQPVRVLFVCLGNICRSPVADGVFRQKVAEAGLSGKIIVDSAGTGSWHVGHAPDARMMRTAERHGVDISRLRARQFEASDFERFDHVLAMDRSNLADMLALARDTSHEDKTRLFRDHDPDPGDGQVPDPYYGGDQGFETVYNIVDRTCDALLEELRARHEF